VTVTGPSKVRDREEGSTATRLTPTLFGHLADALAQVFALERPADKVLSGYFRAHPKLGQHERALVAETIYAALRRKRFLEHLGATGEPRRIALAALAWLGGFSVRALEGIARPAEVRWLAGTKSAGAGEMPFGVVCDLPDWIVERLRAAISEDAVLELARAMQDAAPLDLRVNVAKSDRDAAWRALREDGIAAMATPYSPIGIRVAGRPAIIRHRLFLAGTIEVQEEASQLVCQLVGTRRGEMVADFCAGDSLPSGLKVTASVGSFLGASRCLLMGP